MATLEREKSKQKSKKRHSLQAIEHQIHDLFNSSPKSRTPPESPFSPLLDNTNNEDELIVGNLMLESFDIDDLSFSDPPSSSMAIQPSSESTSVLTTVTPQVPDLANIRNGRSPIRNSLVSTPIDSNDPEESLDFYALLAPELLASLESLKQVCLKSLDSLLEQLASDITSIPIATASEPTSILHHQRSRSESFHVQNLARHSNNPELLESIRRNATKIAPSSSLGPRMKRSDSSPTVSTLVEIHERLDAYKPVNVTDDYRLACALAALLSYIYQMLDIAQSSNESSRASTPSRERDDNDTNNDETSSVYERLRREVSTFKHRKRMSMTIPEGPEDPFDERIAIWNEMDRLMEVISRLAVDRSLVETSFSPPPQYADRASTDTDTKPPSYKNDSRALDEKQHHLSQHQQSRSSLDAEKAQHELDNVIAAIDRVHRVAPRLNNQRVELTEKQAKEMAAAAVEKAVERLSRGRLETQRASSSSSALARLVEQITRAAASSFANQRVELSSKQQSKIETARMVGLVERLEKRRMVNQDWHSKEQLLLKDLSSLTQKITASAARTNYFNQRYTISAFKERDMFMSEVFGKIERLRERRLSNQDALPPRPKSLAELDGFAERLARLSSASLEEQRAELRPKRRSVTIGSLGSFKKGGS